MRVLGPIALGLAAATPAGAQQVSPPQVVAPAAPATEAAETGTANQATLLSTAAQTARIRQDRDGYAAGLAAYERAQARYARDLEEFEAARRAVARKAADDAAAYGRQMAEWRRANEARAPVKRPAATTAAARGPAPAGRTTCAMETPTGSLMPVRRCRSVAQADAERDSARRNLDASVQKGNAMTGR